MIKFGKANVGKISSTNLMMVMIMLRIQLILLENILKKNTQNMTNQTTQELV